MFRLKDGQQRCPKCSGTGCYWCRMKGYRVQCPRCANSEVELLTDIPEGWKCLACDTKFSKSGRIVPAA